MLSILAFYRTFAIDWFSLSSKPANRLAFLTLLSVSFPSYDYVFPSHLCSPVFCARSVLPHIKSKLVTFPLQIFLIVTNNPISPDVAIAVLQLVCIVATNFIVGVFFFIPALSVTYTSCIRYLKLDIKKNIYKIIRASSIVRTESFESQ